MCPPTTQATVAPISFNNKKSFRMILLEARVCEALQTIYDFTQIIELKRKNWKNHKLSKFLLRLELFPTGVLL